MMRRARPIVLLALAACSDRDAAGTDGSESDFASRIGTANAPASPGGAAPASSTAVKGPPPVGASVFAMEQLGDIGGVDLGPRAGGCTFVSSGAEMLVAAGPADRALPGKGVVRIGGRLNVLDTPPGGIETIKAGTTFQGEGFSVAVRPLGRNQAAMTITDGTGQTKTVAGDYVCA